MYSEAPDSRMAKAFSASGRCRGCHTGLLLALTATLVISGASDKIPIHESPYFLGGLTNTAYEYTADSFEGTAFRVFGLHVDREGLSGGVRQLSWYDAEKACADVGLGLAAVATSDRKHALDDAILESETILPLLESQPFFWIGGYRTSLSDPGCTSGPVTVWPYFNESAQNPEQTYNDCGKDPVYDWAWARPRMGSFSDATKQFFQWRDLDYTAEWWYQYAAHLNRTRDPQPTGWKGAWNTKGWPLGGNYENCTVAEIPYPRNNAYNEFVANLTWYQDWGCLGTQPRWICEMEDAKQGADAAALAERTLEATVTASPFYVAGVTGTVHTLNDYTHYRMLGVAPHRRKLFKSPAESGHMTWDEARQACYAAGASDLAIANDTESATKLSDVVRAVSESFLKQWGVAESTFSVWLGGATEKAATSAGSSLTNGDFLWFSGASDAGTSIDEPARWAPGWPKAGPLYVAASDATNMTSCMTSVWDGTSRLDSWQNTKCDDASVHYFICTFASPEIGLAVAPAPAGANNADTPLPGDGTSPSGTTPLSPNETNDKKSSGNSSLGFIVGGAAAAVVLCILALLTGIFVVRRRRRSRGQLDHASSSGTNAALPIVADSKTQFTPARSASRQHGEPPHAALRVQVSAREDGLHAQRSACDGATTIKVPVLVPRSDRSPAAQFVTMTSVTTYTMQDTPSNYSALGNTYPSVDPTRGTTKSEAQSRMELLNAQLDELIDNGSLFARKYVLGDHNDRRQGGQGVVQFARKRYDGLEYAIKFFLSMHAFEAEKALYETPTVQRILPHIEDMADPARPDTDHIGRPLPPYIVMERGEALDEWSMRANPDLPTTVTVLSHLATRLADLHKAGMVHRDLKPGNVMWLPRENRWTIMDFGCVAIIGQEAPLAFSLSYAAPEVIAAYDAANAGTGTSTMVVTAALDAWSIGVMIFRMLTTDPGEHMRESKHIITIEQLRGDELLPWEGSNLTPDKKRRLGILRKPILKLLSRDPALRLTMAELKAECDGIFAGKTTVMSNDSGTSGV